MSRRVSDDLEEIARYIATDSPMNAERMIGRIEAGMNSLSLFPERCPVAREVSNAAGTTIRHLIVRPYHVLFLVERQVVRVLRIRHEARLPPDAGELLG